MQGLYEEGHHHQPPHKEPHEEGSRGLGSGSGLGLGSKSRFDDEGGGDDVDDEIEMWFKTSIVASPLSQLQQTKTDSLLQLLPRPSSAAAHYHRHVMGQQQGDSPVVQKLASSSQKGLFDRPRNTSQREKLAGPSSPSVVSLAEEPRNRYTGRHIPRQHEPPVIEPELGPGSVLSVKTTMSDLDWFASLDDEDDEILGPVYTPIPAAHRNYHEVDPKMVAPVQQQQQQQQQQHQMQHQVQQSIGLILSQRQRARSAGPSSPSVVSLAEESRNRYTGRHIPRQHEPPVIEPELRPGSALSVKTTMSDLDWFASLEDETVPAYTPIRPTDT